MIWELTFRGLSFWFPWFKYLLFMFLLNQLWGCPRLLNLTHQSVIALYTKTCDHLLDNIKCKFKVLWFEVSGCVSFFILIKECSFLNISQRLVLFITFWTFSGGRSNCWLKNIRVFVNVLDWQHWWSCKQLYFWLGNLLMIGNFHGKVFLWLFDDCLLANFPLNLMFSFEHWYLILFCFPFFASGELFPNILSNLHKFYILVFLLHSFKRIDKLKFPQICKFVFFSLFVELLCLC